MYHQDLFSCSALDKRIPFYFLLDFADTLASLNMIPTDATLDPQLLT